MKNYDSIISLDFELYNSYCYWSICWAGMVTTDLDLSLKQEQSILVDPKNYRQHTGDEITFPFDKAELKKQPPFSSFYRKFNAAAKGETLVIGHATENDVRMMISACRRFSLPFPKFDFIDTNLVSDALSGEFKEQSLSTLAAKYGIEFGAHDPLEDARATLLVAKAMLAEKGTDLKELIDSTVKVGSTENGLVRRCYYDAMPPRALERLKNYNAVFDAAKAWNGVIEPLSNVRGRIFHLDGRLALEQNVGALVTGILAGGGTVSCESLPSSVTIENKQRLGRRDYMSLRDAVSLVNLSENEKRKLDYSDISLSASGERIKYSEYLEQKYRKGNGFLDGKEVVFCKAAERRHDFESVYAAAVRNGANVSCDVHRPDYFVIDNFRSYKANRYDGRIKAYKKIKSGELVTVDDFIKIFGGV